MKKWVDEFYKYKDRKIIETKYFNKLYDIAENQGLIMSKKEDIIWNPENDWGGKTVYDDIKLHP